MPPPGSVRSQREARRRADIRKKSLIEELGLAKDVDPRVAEAIFSRVPDPVYTITKAGRAQRQRPATRQETVERFTKGYQAELAKIGQPQIAEAVTAGADPRTVEALRTSLISTYTKPKTKGISRGAAANLRRRERAVAEQTQPVKDILKSETVIQPELQQIRRRREKAVKQQVSLLRRGTGRRALLTSPTGGAGFFGGYFKG